MPNRLAEASSPYLRQHADNPVDWQEWTDETWAQAVAENKPVFLSVGYSSCHWCHVMAHESFEDQEIADVLNKNYISIKLDREERPDIDDLYMTAVQLATGHGGWPMSVFLTPEKKPFFAGTYFPRNGHGQTPGFHTILTNIADAWEEEQSEILEKADEFAQGLTRVLEREIPPVSRKIDIGLLDQAMQQFHTVFDYEEGGFGERPKFPPHALLQFLPRYAHHRHRLPGDSASVENYVNDATHMALLTLEKMASSGLHDIVGGGFHRYATDSEWILPHFEKMLYDNAQLLSAYALVSNLLDDQELVAKFKEVSNGIVSWLQREMMTPEGLFYSALDADSKAHPEGESEEGLYYLWGKAELENLLGEDADQIIRDYNVAEDGNFHEEATGELTGRNILYRRDLVARPAVLDKLLEARNHRPKPALDDKCLCSWNALMAGALAQAGFHDLALTNLEHWMALDPEHLPHQIVNGHHSGHAFLDDYAYLADALLDLHDATQNDLLYCHAERLADQMVEHFTIPGKPGFAFSQPRHGNIFGITKPAMDNATPSPNGVAIRVLRRLGRRDEALYHLGSVLGWAQRIPQATATILTECLEHLLIEGETELAMSTPDQKVKVDFAPVTPQLGEDGFAHATLTITVPNLHHINSHDPSANWLIPTTVKVDGVYGEAGFPDSPDGTYHGVVEIPVRLQPKGTQTEFQINLSYQLCSDTECYAAESEVFEGRIDLR